MMVTTYLETFIFTHIFFQNPQRNLSPIWNLFNSRIDIRDTKKKIDYMKLTNISRILTCTDVSHQCHTKLVYFRSRCREISHQCRKQLGLNFQSSDSDRCTENRLVVNECWKKYKYAPLFYENISKYSCIVNISIYFVLITCSAA